MSIYQSEVPQENQSAARQPHHAASVRMWANVVPNSMRIASMVSSSTGQEHAGFFCLAEEGGQYFVWMCTRNGWDVAPGWMARAYLAKRDEMEGTAQEVPSTSVTIPSGGDIPL